MSRVPGHRSKDIRYCVFHGLSALFDDPNLVSCAGLAPVLALGRRCDLRQLVATKANLYVPVGRIRSGGANADLKVLVAGMIAGADSIDDIGLLRHGGTGRLLAAVRTPSTLGTVLRCFTLGMCGS